MQSRSTEKLLKNLDGSFLDENIEHEFGFHFFDIQLLSFAIAKSAVCGQQNPNYNTQNPKYKPWAYILGPIFGKIFRLFYRGPYSEGLIFGILQYFEHWKHIIWGKTLVGALVSSAL